MCFAEAGFNGVASDINYDSRTQDLTQAAPFAKLDLCRMSLDAF